MKTTLRFGLIAILVSLSSAPALAQRIEDRSPRLETGLLLGAAGELDARTGSASLDSDLDTSIGFDLRVDVPVADFLAVGGWFQFLSVEGEGAVAEREESVAFDAFIRPRWVFDVADGDLFLEPYVLVPIGLTLAILPDGDGSGDDVWAGFNTGVFGGLQVIHASGFGGFFELGWRHAQVFFEETLPFIGDVEANLTLNELALNFGVIFAFGGR